MEVLNQHLNGDVTAVSRTQIKALRLLRNKLTVQLDGESVLHVHTARLGNPSYC